MPAAAHGSRGPERPEIRGSSCEALPRAARRRGPLAARPGWGARRERPGRWLRRAAAGPPLGTRNGPARAGSGAELRGRSPERAGRWLRRRWRAGAVAASPGHRPGGRTLAVPAPAEQRLACRGPDPGGPVAWPSGLARRAEARKERGRRGSAHPDWSGRSRSSRSRRPRPRTGLPARVAEWSSPAGARPEAAGRRSPACRAVRSRRSLSPPGRWAARAGRRARCQGERREPCHGPGGSGGSGGSSAGCPPR